MLDFQDIKNRVSYNDVLSFLALNGKRVGEQFRAKCPACNTDNDRSLVLTAGKGAYCFAAGKGGDILWLVSHVRGIGVRQTAQEIVDHFHLNGQPVPQEPASSKPVVPQAAKTETPKDARILSPLTYLQYEHEAVQSLGLDPNTAQRLGIGFANKGLMRGRVAIPLYEGTTLAGYIGIAQGADTKLPNNLTKAQ